MRELVLRYFSLVFEGISIIIDAAVPALIFALSSAHKDKGRSEFSERPRLTKPAQAPLGSARGEGVPVPLNPT